jgi:hypothetical protein
MVSRSRSAAADKADVCPECKYQLRGSKECARCGWVDETDDDDDEDEEEDDDADNE